MQVLRFFISLAERSPTDGAAAEDTYIDARSTRVLGLSLLSVALQACHVPPPSTSTWHSFKQV